MIAQKIELAPLETLYADAAYLVDMAVNGSMDAGEVVAVIRSRIDAAREGLNTERPASQSLVLQGLLPCPFCGGAAKEFDRLDSNTITCQGCGAKIKQSEMGQGDAAARWNRRPELTQQAEDLKWRDLALQFDGHRMQALAWLKMILSELPADAYPFARTFLKSPPMSGEAVLAERIEALAQEQVTSTWVGNTDADAALIMLDRLDTRGDDDDSRVDEIAATIRRLARQHNDRPEADK